MLGEILREFKKSAGAVNLAELSKQLGVEQSALDGMLETLVRQGKIREIQNEQSGCACHCGSFGCSCGGGCCQGRVFMLNEV